MFVCFQTTLKALFPAAAGRRNEERVIPQLPKRIFAGRSHVARVAEARLEQINRYFQVRLTSNKWRESFLGMSEWVWVGGCTHLLYSCTQ